MTNNIHDVFINIIKEINNTETNKIWNNSKYEAFRYLQIDKRGSVGERFLFSILADSKYVRRMEYNDGDQGDWDIKIGGAKFEIKTSSLDVNSKFQNEGIKNTDSYDGIIFLGVSPEALFIKMVNVKDIPFDKLHNRKKAGTGAGYKWDFKIPEMSVIETKNDIISLFEQTFDNLITKK